MKRNIQFTSLKIKNKKYLHVNILQNTNMYLPPPMAKESKSPLTKNEFSPVQWKHLKGNKCKVEGI